MTLLVALTLASCVASNPYRAADEQERGEVIAAVRDYYGLRNRLTAGLEINDFWQTYPELSYDHDLARGINLEVTLWTWSHDPQLVRHNYKTDLESYQAIRVFVRANEAIAFVHGLESYEHVVGSIPTRGEFYTVLSLTRGGRAWTVVKTDEQMLGERVQTDPPTR